MRGQDFLSIFPLGQFSSSPQGDPARSLYSWCWLGPGYSKVDRGSNTKAPDIILPKSVGVMT